MSKWPQLAVGVCCLGFSLWISQMVPLWMRLGISFIGGFIGSSVIMNALQEDDNE